MLLVLFFAAFQVSFCSIVRLPCKMQANFDVKLDGQAFSGTALAVFNQATKRECVLHCLANGACKCMNHNKLTSVCEIFNTSFYDAVRSLAPKPGWTFIATPEEVYFSFL